MNNFGQLWTLVLATEGTDGEASSLLSYVLNRAARTADRERVWAVVTQEQRRQLMGPLWLLRASNLIDLPQPGSTTFGILMGLLRILQRDPAARIVILPARHAERNEQRLMRSLRDAAAHTIVRPDDLFILGAEPEAQDMDFSRIVAGSVWALLRLIEGHVPDIIAQVQAVVRGRDPEAKAELHARLQGLDFHRHVLPGNEQYLSVLPVPADARSRGVSGAAMN